jgi:hypothetical protein
MNYFSLEKFQNLISHVTSSIGNLPLDKNLQQMLNEKFPFDSEIFKNIENACHAGIQSGDLCVNEYGGIKFGRAIKECSELNQFSVDLVDMTDVVGPHHSHPHGEIDLIMPITQEAKFDGHGAGWLVYESNSAHKPTVIKGRALVLYLLPNGSIEFTRT